MEASDIMNGLIKLVHANHDIVKTYEQASKNIDVLYIHKAIKKFCLDHQSNITNLVVFLRKLEIDPYQLTKFDEKFFLQGFTAIQDATGTERALKIMLDNEKFINNIYCEALIWKNVPADIRKILELNYVAEQHHFQYIADIVSSCPWEHADASE